MCGIWAFIRLINNINYNDKLLYEDFIKLQHRGPDFSSFQNFFNKIYIGFHRLAIMDPAFHANQPYIIEDNNRTIIFICNGEIYNFKELNTKHNLNIINNSDCMVIPKLYLKYCNENDDLLSIDNKNFYKLFNNDIKGEFAFILCVFDKLHNLKEILIGRDQIGIRPLYYHPPNENSENLIFSSEIKGMSNFNDTISEFEPGLLMNIKINDFQTFNSIETYNFKTVYNTKSTLNIISEYKDIEKYYLMKIKIAVINSIKRRLSADKPFAFLLSGGVDSSLVSAISAKLLNTKINTYCCGMHNDAPDLINAKIVADYIKSNHTNVYFSENEGLNILKDVIYTTETWDTTTIRASIGQYLISKYIGQNTDAKVVMIGEGPDEVCSSYLFNYYAPSSDELHNTAIEFVKNIHLFDCRRTDRCISRWGLESRVPLLDPEFIETYWSLPAEWRHPKYKGIEKWWLRKAFEDTNILPTDILWRKKEAFSDGISSKNNSWYLIISNYLSNLNEINDQKYINNNLTYETYFFKKFFIEFFGHKRLNIIPHYWQPKWINNNNEYIDPSARILDVY